MELLKKIIAEDPLAAFDDVKAGLLFTDLQGRVMHANTALLEMFDLELAAIVDKNCCEVLHPLALDCKDCHKEDYVQIGRGAANTVRHFVVSSSIIRRTINLKIIKDITKALVSLGSLAEEVERLKIIVNAVIGDGNALIVCAECKKFRMMDGSWVIRNADKDISLLKGLSHGLCPKCARATLETLRSFQEFVQTTKK